MWGPRQVTPGNLNSFLPGFAWLGSQSNPDISSSLRLFFYPTHPVILVSFQELLFIFKSCSIGHSYFGSTEDYFVNQETSCMEIFK